MGVKLALNLSRKQKTSWQKQAYKIHQEMNNEKIACKTEKNP